MQINAEKRTQFGKKTKKLRREYKVPAVVFGKEIESIPITIDVNDFIRVFREAGETNLIDLVIGDTSEKVLVKQVDLHPVNSGVLHVNFHQVNLKEKLTASIPVEIVGEEENALIESGDALPLTLLSEITIEALPTDLPDSFTVDISGLAEIGDGITISELEYDKSKIEIVGYEEDELIVKIDYAVQEEEEEEELTEEEMLGQIEVTGEKEPTEDDDGDESEEE